MRCYRATLAPCSAFGTPLKGDTLFGQLCWALRNRHGEDQLTEWLDGYCEGRPFAVLSDAFPAGHLPRPQLPGHWFKPVAGGDRKAAKKRLWMPLERFAEPVTNWLTHCRSSAELPGAQIRRVPHPHNTIDRRTGTTGRAFAPYTLARDWYGGENERPLLDLYLLIDESRIAVEKIAQALRDIGELGFGRDATIGLGHFAVAAFTPFELPAQPGANSWLSLAPSAPQGLPWQPHRSFYSLFTRFGRHGDLGVLYGNPFKTPLLLAQTAAVLTPKQFAPTPFIGQGLGGDGSLSKVIPATLHQGYAPVVALRLPDAPDGEEERA
jgi:CRISPR-associated protein Csm4